MGRFGFKHVMGKVAALRSRPRSTDMWLFTPCLYFPPLENASTSPPSTRLPHFTQNNLSAECLPTQFSRETVALIEITVSFHVLKPSALSDRHYSEHSCWQIVIKRFVNAEWLKRLQAFHWENQHANCFLCNCCCSVWWIQLPPLFFSLPLRQYSRAVISLVMECTVWRISISQHILFFCFFFLFFAKMRNYYFNKQLLARYLLFFFFLRMLS